MSNVSSSNFRSCASICRSRTFLVPLLATRSRAFSSIPAEKSMPVISVLLGYIEQLMPVPTPTSRIVSPGMNLHALERLHAARVEGRPERQVVHARELLVHTLDEIVLYRGDRQRPSGRVALQKLVFGARPIFSEQCHQHAPLRLEMPKSTTSPQRDRALPRLGNGIHTGHRRRARVRPECPERRRLSHPRQRQ